MENHDILIRLRYALDIKDQDMAGIFKLGGTDISTEEVREMLTSTREREEEDLDLPVFTNKMMESFLNGFITWKRGPQKPKPGQPEAPSGGRREHVNNMLLKKVKIALSLTSEDLLEIFDLVDITVTKGELGAFLRKEGHRNYKECGDKYARKFLKGLAIKYRG